MVKFISLLTASCVIFGAATAPNTALADGPLIWTPVKVAPRIYQATLGLRLPVPLDASAGANLGLGSAPGGRLLSGSELATLWGKVIDSRKTLDGSDDKALVINIDTLSGDGSLSLSRSRRWVYSENLDLQSARTLSLNYTAANSAPASVNATQSLTIAYPGMGTSVGASVTLANDIGGIAGGLTLAQPVAPHLNFNASFNAPIASERTGNVQMRYRIKW